MVEVMVMTKKELIEQAFAHVYADFETYVKVIAREHTVANMGQSLDWLVGDPKWTKPDQVVNSAFQQLRNDCESDEMADGIDEEYRSWLKDAKRDATRVREAGLPLTLENARLAFENKGPFARPSGQKRGKR